MLKFKNTLNSLILSIILGIFIGSPFVLIAIKERDVTLEKVQIVDFKILSAALNEITQKDNISKSINNILNPLNFKFSIAFLDNKSCTSNYGGEQTICSSFKNKQNFVNSLNESNLEKIRGIEAMYFQQKRFYFKEISNLNGFLIAEAGKKGGLYICSNEPDCNEIEVFLNKLPNMISDSYYELFIKFNWLWFFILFIAPLIGITIDFQQNKKRQAIAIKEKQINSLQEQLTEQSLKINNLYRHHNKDKTLSMEPLIEKLNAERKNHDETRKRLEELENERIDILTGLPKSDIKNSTHKDRAQLRNIKGLWNAQYKWERRFDEEKSFVGKTPFGVSGAFIAFEIYLKNAYQELQKDFDELTLEEIIDYLFEQGHLRPNEKSLLHETRIARNAWVHDAKYPNEKIIDNIIEFLNTRNQAWPLS